MDACSHCETHEPTTPLRDGQIICTWCVPLFTVCERCSRDVLIKDATTVEGEFRHDGYACISCVGGE